MTRKFTLVRGDVFSSELGWIGLLWTPHGISCLTFGHPSATEAIRRLDESAELGWQTARAPVEWQRELRKFSVGEPVDLRCLPVDLRAKTAFQQRVLQACRRIAYGRTSTYIHLARHVGSPQAARAVGQVMARNPVPLIIPCHRVLGSGGKLGGFSAPSGLAMKRRLLTLEAGSRTASVAGLVDPGDAVGADP
jgi:methylated-DNA-[protein]-cysteine S-methyltransferase